ncbi:MAG TPA: putative sulfate exporter family transporter [Jatrophihabitans sp.]|jgi:uncharacterized integral membrane protein (TIGR00698 family)
MAAIVRAEPVTRDDARGRESIVPGLVAVAVLAAAATCAGHVVPVVGAPVCAVALGAALSLRARKHPRLRPGITFAAGRVLQVAVLLMGAGLSLAQVVHVGAASLPVMLGTLTVCLTLAAVLGQRLGINRDLRTLIGVGTGICGASAIAAVAPAIRAKNPDIAYAVSTIFIFNVAAVLTFPALGHALHLGQHAFGLFAGTAVNDTSSVMAAAATYGPVAGQYAVVVKLTRTLMIVPITLALAAVTRRADDVFENRSRSVTARAFGLVPWFLVGFIVLAAVNSLGLIPASAHPLIGDTASVLVTVALAAIGLSTDLAGIRRAGTKPLFLGFLLWIAVTTTSLALRWV